MMESLLTSASSTKNDLKTQSRSTSVDTASEAGQDKQKFSKILDDNTEKEVNAKTKVDENDEAPIASEEAVASGDKVDETEAKESSIDTEIEFETEIIDVNLLDPLENIDVELSDVTIADSDLTDLTDVAFDTTYETAKSDNVDNESIDDLSLDIDSEQAQLLSSIQSAQQVNTKVNTPAGNAQDSDQIDTKLGVLASDVSTSKVATQTVVNQSVADKSLDLKNSDLSVDTLETDLPVELEGELSVESTLGKTDSDKLSSEKSDSLPAMLKSEHVAATQNVVDVNGAKPIQTNAVQTDRLVAVNQQTQTMNNLLDEPLDIQSKQAASMLGDRVMMMISQGKQEVSIRLDPAELGSMFIKVNIQQDQVQLNIQTQVALSKEVIEQNIPRLREQLAQQGIQLGDANVEQQSQQQNQQNNNQVNTASEQRNSHSENIEEGQTAAWIPSKISSVEQGIDYYA